MSRWLLLLLLFTGCRDKTDPSVVDKCKEAALGDGGYRDLAAACADLYREKPCREAYLAGSDPDADPSQFARTVFEACRDAYCPKLAAPKPKACSAEQSSWDPIDVARSMTELNRHILAYELDDGSAADLQQAFVQRAASLKQTPAVVLDLPEAVPPECTSFPPSPERMSVVVYLEVTSKTISVDGKMVAAVVAGEVDGEKEIEAVYRALAERSQSWRAAHSGAEFSGVALMRIDQDVTAALMKSLIRSCHHAGFPQISFCSPTK